MSNYSVCFDYVTDTRCLIFFSGDRPKDAIRAVKKRLNGNKNYREVMLTLTVGKYF